jgi:hypothetical protein
VKAHENPASLIPVLEANDALLDQHRDRALGIEGEGSAGMNRLFDLFCVVH